MATFVVGAKACALVAEAGKEAGPEVGPDEALCTWSVLFTVRVSWARRVSNMPGVARSSAAFTSILLLRPPFKPPLPLLLLTPPLPPPLPPLPLLPWDLAFRPFVPLVPLLLPLVSTAATAAATSTAASREAALPMSPLATDEVD